MIFSTSTPSISSQIRPDRAWKASRSSSVALPGVGLMWMRSGDTPPSWASMSATVQSLGIAIDVTVAMADLVRTDTRALAAKVLLL